MFGEARQETLVYDYFVTDIYVVERKEVGTKAKNELDFKLQLSVLCFKRKREGKIMKKDKQALF